MSSALHLHKALHGPKQEVRPRPDDPLIFDPVEFDKRLKFIGYTSIFITVAILGAYWAGME